MWFRWVTFSQGCFICGSGGWHSVTDVLYLVQVGDILSKMCYMCFRWVMNIENRVCEVDSKVVIHLETLKKLKHRMEIIGQVCDAPNIYCRAICEVVRRKTFATHFMQVNSLISWHWVSTLIDFKCYPKLWYYQMSLWHLGTNRPALPLCGKEGVVLYELRKTLMMM